MSPVHIHNLIGHTNEQGYLGYLHFQQDHPKEKSRPQDALVVLMLLILHTTIQAYMQNSQENISTIGTIKN